VADPVIQVTEAFKITALHIVVVNIIQPVEATASSVYSEYNHPSTAIDGQLVRGWEYLYHSLEEVNTWLQLEFVESIIVTGVVVTVRADCCAERFQNVAIYVGDETAVIGALSTNPECARFEGMSSFGAIEKIICTESLVGLYLQVQMYDSHAQYLHINEIEVL
jgi:hypothetical protein